MSTNDGQMMESSEDVSYENSWKLMEKTIACVPIVHRSRTYGEISLSFHLISILFACVCVCLFVFDDYQFQFRRHNRSNISCSLLLNSTSNYTLIRFDQISQCHSTVRVVCMRIPLKPTIPPYTVVIG